jgi:predicted PurR-regulated permease PerM
MFIGAMIIAGVFLVSSESSTKFYQNIMRRLLGDEKGLEWSKLSVLTVRSVAVGVIGVAVIQASFALLGLLIMEVPFAMIIALGIMFLTIIQLPALIIIAPVIAYVFS